MYLPLEYVKRYSVLTELYCSEEYINCEPEVLLEMIADADWGTSNYSGPNKERYIHTYNMFDNNYFAMHIISACFATAGFAGVWKYNKIVYEPDYDFSQALIGTNKLRVYPEMLKHIPFNTFYLVLSKMHLHMPWDFRLHTHVPVYVNIRFLSEERIFLLLLYRILLLVQKILHIRKVHFLRNPNRRY